jgi:hypothetical protein
MLSPSSSNAGGAACRGFHFAVLRKATSAIVSHAIEPTLVYVPVGMAIVLVPIFAPPSH